jgi:hypothetical protein
MLWEKTGTAIAANTAMLIILFDAPTVRALPFLNMLATFWLFFITFPF